jgi:hypothetical protein
MLAATTVATERYGYMRLAAADQRRDSWNWLRPVVCVHDQASGNSAIKETYDPAGLAYRPVLVQ